MPRRTVGPGKASVSVREIWSPEQGRGDIPLNTYRFEDYTIGSPLSAVKLAPGPFCLSVIEENTQRIQGLMRLYIGTDTNRHRIFVSQMDSAPWNLEINQATHEPNPLFDPAIALSGIGKVMLAATAQIHFRLAQAITEDDASIYGLGCLSAIPIFKHLGLKPSTVCGNIALSSKESFALLQRTIDNYGADLPG